MRDPVKSVIECGIGDDVDTVIVDGKVCMQGGVIPGVDFHRLRAEAQAAGEVDLVDLAGMGSARTQCRGGVSLLYPEAS